MMIILEFIGSDSSASTALQYFFTPAYVVCGKVMFSAFLSSGGSPSEQVWTGHMGYPLQP